LAAAARKGLRALPDHVQIISGTLVTMGIPAVVLLLFRPLSEYITIYIPVMSLV
jgi:hypothetical protein